MLEAIILRAVQSVTTSPRSMRGILKDGASGWEERYARAWRRRSRSWPPLPTAWRSWTLIRGLFEGSVTGVMPERQIQRLSKAYDEEQTALEKRLRSWTLAEIPT